MTALQAEQKVRYTVEANQAASQAANIPPWSLQGYISYITSDIYPQLSVYHKGLRFTELSEQLCNAMEHYKNIINK